MSKWKLLVHTSNANRNGMSTTIIDFDEKQKAIKAKEEIEETFNSYTLFSSKAIVIET